MEKQSLYIKRTMDGEEHYFPSDTERAVVGTFTYNAKRMGGAPTLEATLNYPRCLDDEWTHREYVEFRGEKYYVSQVPTSSKDSGDERYVHEITFISERKILENVYFLDVVTDNTETAYKDRYRSNNAEFSFSGDIVEFVARLNDSLEYSGLYDHATGDGYHVMIDDGITSDVAAVSFENQYVAEAIQEIYNTYDLTYYWVGKVCHVGYTENAISLPVIKYGRGNGLTKIEKANSNEMLCDRIGGHGGSDNIPWYYPNSNPSGTAVFRTENMEASGVSKINLDTLLGWNVNFQDAYTLKERVGDTFSGTMPGSAFTKREYIKQLEVENLRNYTRQVYVLRHFCVEYISQPMHISAGTSIALGNGHINSDDVISITDSMYYYGKLHEKLVGVSGFSVPGDAHACTITHETFGRIHAVHTICTGIDVCKNDVELFIAKDIMKEQQVIVSAPNGTDTGSVYSATLAVPYKKISPNDVVDEDIEGVAYIVARKTFEYRVLAYIDLRESTTESATTDFEPVVSSVLQSFPHSFKLEFGSPSLLVCAENSGNNVAYAKSGIAFADVDNAGKDTYAYEFVLDKYAVSELNYAFDAWQFKKVETASDTPAKVIVTGREWIAPSEYLMPPIYRDTGGAERFYNAINGKYEVPGGENGETYVFNNPFVAGAPHEHMEDFEDIYPTIKDLENANGQLIGEVADVAFDSDDSDILKDNSDEYKHQYFYIKLHVFNGECGFNLFAQASATDEAKIVMTSGNCSTCVFPIRIVKQANSNGTAYTFHNPVATDNGGNLVKMKSSRDDGYLGDYIYSNGQIDSYTKRQQNTYSNEVWIACQKDNDTFGVLMPNAANNYRPQKGDTFVITGIDMPDSYILAAEKRLEQSLVKYMKANNDEKFTFSATFSRIFLAKNEGFSSKLNENARILVEYNGHQHSLYISSFTCKADDNILYEIEVEITDELTVQQSSVRTQIDAVKSDIMSTVGSIDFLKSGLRYFLRKDTEDAAAGRITFNGGLTATDVEATNAGIANANIATANAASATITNAAITNAAIGEVTSATIYTALQTLKEGMLTDSLRNIAATDADRDILTGRGYDIYMGGDGRSHLWVDELTVRMKAYFASLEIRKVSYAGGTTVFSNAGSTLAQVTPVTDDDGSVTAYKCYALADDGTTHTMNWWHVGDQALCQTFNVGEGTTENAANRRYWRLVIATGQERLDDGRDYDLVVLSNRKSFTGEAEGMEGTDDGGGDIATRTFVGYEQGVAQDAPERGDVLVQVGSQTAWNSRGNAIILLTSTQDGMDGLASNAPAIRLYHGIASYEWKDLVAVISPAKTSFNTQFFEVFADDAANGRPLVVYMGDWTRGTQYAYYQQVSYGGQLWTWLDPDAKPDPSTPPSEAGGWTLTVQKGDTPSVYDVRVIAAGGATLINGQGSKRLTAYVYKDGEDITGTIPPTSFSWTRDSGDKDDDATWGKLHAGVGNSIAVTKEDVFRSASFSCTAYIEE